MRLANQTFIVYGAQRAAIYQLRNVKESRIQRIPQDVARILENGLHPENDVQRRWLDFCEKSGFAEPDAPSYWQRFVPEWSYTFNRKLSTVSVEIDASGPSDLLINWVKEARLFGLHIFFFVQGKVDEFCMRGICRMVRETGAASFEVTLDIDSTAKQSIYTIVFDAQGTPVAKRVLSDGSRFVDRLDPSLQLYLLQRKFSEAYGQIHVDLELNIWPTKGEEHFRLGTIESVSLNKLILTKEWMHVIGASKEKREKCCECELRYACLHDYTKRLEKDRIESRPEQCGYDPHATDWQKQLFRTI